MLESLAEIKLESRLPCMYIYEDDCTSLTLLLNLFFVRNESSNPDDRMEASGSALGKNVFLIH